MPEKDFSYMYRLVHGIDNFNAIETQLLKRGITGAGYIDQGHQRLYRIPVEELHKIDRGHAKPFALPVDDHGNGYLLREIMDNDPDLIQLSERGWQDVSESSTN